MFGSNFFIIYFYLFLMKEDVGEMDFRIICGKIIGYNVNPFANRFILTTTAN